MKKILFILVLISLSFYALFPSFKLGLYGDDWFVIWRYFYTLGPISHGSWNYLTYFLSRYGSFDLIVGFLVGLVGYQSVYFYLTAYILRLIAALSFYPLVYYITKNKLCSYFSVIFFSITAVGLETTNWVFNMPSYIAIAFLNFFFLFYTKSALEDNKRFFYISLLFVMLAIFIASVRMTGIVSFVIFMELFLFLKIYKIKRIKLFAIRIVSFLGWFSLLILIGQLAVAVGDRKGYELIGKFSNLFGVWNSGLSVGGNLLTAGRIDFLFYPLIIVGNMLLPIDLPSNKQWVFLLTGVSVLIIGVWLIVINLKNRLISTGIFLSLTWLVLSFFFAWLKDPITILPFTHRYLIVSAQGLTIFLAIVTSTGKKLSQRMMILVFSLIILINIHSSRYYLQYQVDNLHGAQNLEKIWSQMPYIPQIGKTKDPILFYFTGENRQIMYGSITFGFPVRMALLYKLDDFSKMPNPVDSWEQVLSAVTDGKSLVIFELPAKPIPIENVYAFRLEGKDNLVNITDQIRSELSKK